MVSNSIRLFFMDVQTVVSIAVLSNLEKEEHEENRHMHDFIERIARVQPFKTTMSQVQQQAASI